MEYNIPLIKKAVFILVVGMAFLIYSCQGGLMMSPERALTGYAGAVADYEAGRYERALETFNRILRDTPDHPEIQMIKYYQAFCYYFTGDFKKSIALATEWMKNYPDIPERYKVQKLAGDASRASGLMYDACFWMTITLKTAKTEGISERFQDSIVASITDIISLSDESDLEKIKELDSIDPFLPSIYFRQAEIALEKESYFEAKKLAVLSIQSATENEQQPLVDKGRDLLHRIIKRIDETTDINRRAIGCLLPLQGPASVFGEELLNGIQLGMDIFKADSTDIPLELVIKNTNGSPEDTLNAIDELIFKEKVIAIIGPLASSTSAVAAKKAQEYGVPIITITQKDNIVEEGDMVFRNYLTPSRELDVLLNKAVNELGMSRFGIFYPDTHYGNHRMNLFWDKVEERGGEITAVESYRPEDTDFAKGIKKMIGLYYPRPESLVEMLKEKIIENLENEISAEDPENPDAQPLKNSPDMQDEFSTESVTAEDPETQSEENPEEEPLDEEAIMAAIEEEARTKPIVDFDAVFIPHNSGKIAQIAPQFPFYKVFNIPLLGTSLWFSGLSDELKSTTSDTYDYLQNAMFPVGFYIDSDSERVRDFVRLYRNTYGKNPEDILAATGFDTIKMIKQMMSDNDISTRNDFQNALLNYDIYEGVTGQISFDEQGEVEKYPILLTVHGRRLQIFQ